MTILYDICFFIFSLVYLPVLIFKGKLHKDFAERFGVYAPEKRARLSAPGKKIWVQAVSVGEVALCRRFIQILKAHYPDHTIIFSTITKTGNDLARRLYAGQAVVFYFPLDFSFIVNKVIALARPELYVMVETELWPNMISSLHARRIPMAVINGRISDKSFGKYRLVKLCIRKMIGSIDLIAVQSVLDESRFIELGARPGNVTVTGNMKFDAADAGSGRPLDELRAILGLKADDAVILGGSTHPGEESMLIDIFKHAKKSGRAKTLVLVPRHIERALSIESLARDAGLSAALFSQIKDGKALPQGIDVFVVDAIGYLNDLYAFATIVFVGGSMIPHGGQNPIEPALRGKAIVFGVHMFNFKDVARLLMEGGGALQVDTKEALSDKINSLLGDERARTRLGANAARIVSLQRGATEKTVEAIEKLMR